MPLNFFGISKEIDFIVEDNKLKHNKFIPGVKIAIKSKSSIKSKNHTLLLLAWNFFNEIKKTYEISGDEYAYINATEHINSIFNLISIIRFNFKGSIEEHFYPFKIKSTDINLFYNVHIYK